MSTSMISRPGHATFTIRLDPRAPLTAQVRRFLTVPSGIWLYRFRDAQGRLLYIGLTTYPAERWTKHKKQKPWWNDVAMVTLRRTLQPMWLALDTERAAIKTEKPLHNKRSAVR